MARRTGAITKQIQAVRRALRAVDRAVADPVLVMAGRKSASAIRRTVMLSPKRRAQLKLHGAYIGHLRHLKPRQRAEVKAIKAKKGYEAAVRVAKRMRG